MSVFPVHFFCVIQKYSVTSFPTIKKESNEQINKKSVFVFFGGGPKLKRKELVSTFSFTIRFYQQNLSEFIRKERTEKKKTSWQLVKNFCNITHTHTHAQMFFYWIEYSSRLQHSYEIEFFVCSSLRKAAIKYRIYSILKCLCAK